MRQAHLPPCGQSPVGACASLQCAWQGSGCPAHVGRWERTCCACKASLRAVLVRCELLSADTWGMCSPGGKLAFEEVSCPAWCCVTQAVMLQHGLPCISRLSLPGHQKHACVALPLATAKASCRTLLRCHGAWCIRVEQGCMLPCKHAPCAWAGCMQLAS